RIEAGVIWFDSSLRREDARGMRDRWNCFVRCNCTEGQPASDAKRIVRRNNSALLLKNGAGLGDVGVQGFDDGGVLLLDDAALELEGEGEAAVVERKVFGEERE